MELTLKNKEMKKELIAYRKFVEDSLAGKKAEYLPEFTLTTMWLGVVLRKDFLSDNNEWQRLKKSNPKRAALILLLFIDLLIESDY